MKLPGRVSIAVAVGASLYWLWSRATLSRVEAPPPPTAASAESTPVVAAKSPQVPRSSTPSPLPPSAAPRPIAVEATPVESSVRTWAQAQTRIPFRIDNNWAIAYGDVLLGTVTAPANVTSGTHEPERPRLWESPVIPYAIHRELTNPARVEAAIKYFNENTPIQFVPLEAEGEDAIVFVPDAKNCASYVGRIGGPQPIMVADRCGRQELIHELMHALGFVHEHSRLDRDQFIEIVWDNIDSQYWPQFAMVPELMVLDYQGRTFDFDSSSAMLYPPSAFPRQPGLVTVQGKAGTRVSPITSGLSASDRERLNVWYGRN